MRAKLHHCLFGDLDPYKITIEVNGEVIGQISEWKIDTKEPIQLIGSVRLKKRNETTNEGDEG